MRKLCAILCLVLACMLGMSATASARGGWAWALPVGAAAVILGGIAYHHHHGRYYRPVPTGGYVIVDPPPQAIINEGASPARLDNVTNVSVVASSLNVRTGPGYNYPAIGAVGQGSVLAVRGMAGGWVNVQLSNGQLGWVAQQFVTPVDLGPSG